MTRTLLLGTLLLATTALPAAAQGRYRDDGRRFGDGDDAPSRLDTTVTLARGGTVSLGLRSGDIVVTTWDRNEVRVKATVENGRVRFDATPSRVNVDNSDASGDTRYEVTVPVGARVSARTANGDVKVSGTGGPVDARTQNGDISVSGANGHVELGALRGDITARDLQGDLAVNTISGDVTVDGMSGDINVEAVSGDLVLRRVTARNVRAHSTSGDVSYAGTIAADGRYDLASHSGDLRLEMPRDASAQLSVSTWNGTIDSDFPITLEPGEHDIGLTNSKHFTFSVGGGAARVTLESFSGDITIRRRDAR